MKNSTSADNRARKSFLAVAVLLLVMAGCGGGGGGGAITGHAPQSGGTPPVAGGGGGNSSNPILAGRVVDTDGNPISGATVKLPGGTSATTDASGAFTYSPGSSS